jgi:hypothetical protein
MVTWPVGSGNGRRPRGGWPSWASAPLPPGTGSPPEKTCCGRRTTYRTAADFLLDNPADNPEVAALYAGQVDTFAAAAALLDHPPEAVSIPYQDTTLPG